MADPDNIHQTDTQVRGFASDASQMDPPSGASTVYVVQDGDTLSDLAEQFGTTTTALAALNNILDPDHIEVGQELRIPATGPDGTVALDPTGKPAAQGANRFTYRVQAGENLTEIAMRFGTSVDAIARLNNLQDPDRIQADQEIQIPSGQTLH